VLAVRPIFGIAAAVTVMVLGRMVMSMVSATAVLDAMSALVLL
jgi:hypothetical protein